MTTITISGVSLNITGLQPFTNYGVSVQASNAPVVDYGPTLSGVFATLPEPEIPPEVDPPTVVVPQAGVGSSEIVEIVIPAPTFTQDHLRYTKCLTVVDFTLCSKFCMSCELYWTMYAYTEALTSSTYVYIYYIYMYYT